ncbi:MAG: fimbria/pilus outer membrane usher protein, partial [Gammaproteobacteria bacterium]
SNAGISLTSSFFGNSLLDTAITTSCQHNLNGYIAFLRYQFNHAHLNLAVDGGYSSQQYGNLYLNAESLQKTKSRLRGSINYQIPFINSYIGASLSQATTWSDRKKSRRLSLFYRQQLYKTLNLNAQVNHDLNTGDNIASLYLSFSPQIKSYSSILDKNNLSYQLGYDDKTHVDTQTWQTQKRGNIGEGYNYTAAFQKNDNTLSGFARYQYKNNSGIYRANYAQNEQSIHGNIGVAGSLSTVNNQVYFGRPITDSFAIVKVKGTENEIPIYSDGARLGNASENKAIVIPNLQSRRIGKMSIRPADMGLDLIADRTEQMLAVGIRSGYFLEFKMKKFIAVEGYAYTLADDGSKQYLEAIPLEYRENGKLQNSFTGKKGFFYLENVPVGEFQAILKSYPYDCILHLTIPKIDKVVAKLGDIACQLKEYNQ